MTRKGKLAIGIIAISLLVLGGAAVYAQDKYRQASFGVDVPDAPTPAFLIEKDSKRFPKTSGWGYALFNHDVAAGKMTADRAAADCGHACHLAVKAKGYIFHPYQKR